MQDSIVDGPGFRYVLFTQGCPHRCEGCQNPETWDESDGAERDVSELIDEMLGNPLTDGLTLSGGEPFYQAGDCAEIARAARERGLNVWTYTGYRFEELLEMAKTDKDVHELLSLTDMLVDGRFVLKEKSYNVKWRGSKNQRVIDVGRSLAEGAAVEIEF
jgi:anaerobic ribonucleoside-triphosphate reductase activating protein